MSHQTQWRAICLAAATTCMVTPLFAEGGFSSEERYRPAVLVIASEPGACVLPRAGEWHESGLFDDQSARAHPDPRPVAPVAQPCVNAELYLF